MKDKICLHTHSFSYICIHTHTFAYPFHFWHSSNYLASRLPDTHKQTCHISQQTMEGLKRGKYHWREMATLCHASHMPTQSSNTTTLDDASTTKICSHTLIDHEISVSCHEKESLERRWTLYQSLMADYFRVFLEML